MCTVKYGCRNNKLTISTCKNMLKHTKAKNHGYFWSNYSDLTRPHPKWWFSKGNLLFQGNLGWWNIIVWPDTWETLGNSLAKTRTAQTPTGAIWRDVTRKGSDWAIKNRGYNAMSTACEKGRQWQQALSFFALLVGDLDFSQWIYV